MDRPPIEGILQKSLKDEYRHPSTVIELCEYALEIERLNKLGLKLFNVRIQFKEESPVYPGKEETFEKVVEIHYNYNNSGRLAIECEDTGYAYKVDWILEFETF